MANRNEHVTIGALAGALAALCLSIGQSDEERLLEALGGCLAGWLGARLPDILDPPTSPNHRGLAHGVLGVGYCAKQYWLTLDGMQAELRGRARLAWAAAQRINDGSQRAGYIFEAVLLSMAVGALPGLLAGYVSHLVLDASTARSIPVIA